MVDRLSRGLDLKVKAAKENWSKCETEYSSLLCAAAFQVHVWSEVFPSLLLDERPAVLCCRQQKVVAVKVLLRDVYVLLGRSELLSHRLNR